MKLKDVSGKGKGSGPKDKMPIIECDETLSKTIDEIVDLKIDIKEREGQIALRRPEIDTKGLDAIVEQILKTGVHQNVKLVSKSGKSVNYSLIDGYKKIDQDPEQIKAFTNKLTSVIGAGNVDEYVGEVTDYSVNKEVLKKPGAEKMFVEFSKKIQEEYGEVAFNCVTEIKVKEGSVKKLNKFASKKETVMDLIKILQITKQMK
jgi:hypothetical protein